VIRKLAFSIVAVAGLILSLAESASAAIGAGRNETRAKSV
jgi:hypothetical protein